MFGSGRGIKVMGSLGEAAVVDANAIAIRLSYQDAGELAQEMTSGKKRASSVGMVPTDPDLPFGHVVQVWDKEKEEFTALVVGNDKNITDKFPQPARLMNNLKQGKMFEPVKSYHEDLTKPNGISEHFDYYISKVNPITNRYDSKVVQTSEEYTKEEMDSLEMDPSGFSGVITVGGVQTRIAVQINSYEEIMNRNTNEVQARYDNAATGKTTVSQVNK